MAPRLLIRGMTWCDLPSSVQPLWAALSREDFLFSQVFDGRGLPPARTFASVAEKTNQRRHGSFRTVHAIDELFTLSKLVGKGGFAESVARQVPRQRSFVRGKKHLQDPHRPGGRLHRTERRGL